jgi:hypothetical protein
MAKTNAKAAMLVVVASLVVALLFANPARASDTDAASDIGNYTYNWFWCTVGYTEYCGYD